MFNNRKESKSNYCLTYKLQYNKCVKQGHNNDGISPLCLLISITCTEKLSRNMEKIFIRSPR